MPARIRWASSRSRAPRTACPRRAAEPSATIGSKKDTRPPSGVSVTWRRPRRIATSPVSPRAQRSAIALASVGTVSTAAASRSSVAASGATSASAPPAAETSSRRATTSSGRSSPSQPAPNTAPITPTPAAASAGAAARTSASASGLASPGALPWASPSPPTSRSTTRSQRSSAPATASPSAMAAGPPFGSTSTVGAPSSSAMRPSAKRNPPGPLASGPASATASCSGRAPVTSSSRRGPGSGSIGRRSQVRPPRTVSHPAAAAMPAGASAPTTSPPPPMPRHRTRRAPCRICCAEPVSPPRPRPRRVKPRCGKTRWPLDERRRPVDHAALDDRLDLLVGAVELLGREHGRALERQVARDVEPRVVAVEVLADLHRHRARDAVRTEQDHVERLLETAPRQALLGVVRRPHVVRRERVDRARVVHAPVSGDLGPRAQTDALGLRDAAVAGERVCGGLAVRPDALLERATQLRLVRGAHDVVAAVLERRIQEEAIVLELEVLLAVVAKPAALAQGDELLAFGERADGDRPFLEGNWHREGRGKKGGDDVNDPGHRATRAAVPRDERHCSKESRDYKTAGRTPRFVADTAVCPQSSGTKPLVSAMGRARQPSAVSRAETPSGSSTGTPMSSCEYVPPCMRCSWSRSSR